MAMAKTNAVSYDAIDPTKDVFSISTAVSMIGAGVVSVTATGNNRFLAVVDNNLYISTDGVSYSAVTVGFDVYDVIYSETLSAFIAVGTGVATSANGETWTAISTDNLFKNPDSRTYCVKTILELDGYFHVVLNDTVISTSAISSYFVKIQIANNAITFEGSNMIYVGSFDVIPQIKGNNRIVFKYASGVNNYLKVYVASAQSIQQVVSPVSGISAYYLDLLSIADGYFYATYNGVMYRSINAVNYTSVGTPAISPKTMQKLVDYYYILGESSMCRGTTIAEVIGKSAEDYVSYDGGLTIPFEKADVINDKIVLMCEGYIMPLTISNGSNDPTQQTIETISAIEALNQAKAYTDEQYALLEARIAALEG